MFLRSRSQSWAIGPPLGARVVWSRVLWEIARSRFVRQRRVFSGYIITAWRCVVVAGRRGNLGEESEIK